MDTSKNKLLKQFGEHVRNLRVRANLSQDDVVNNSDYITKGTVSDIENGKRNLSFTTLIDLAKGLGKKPRDLVNFDIDQNENSL
ncbi:helix-turn-helix domain-containing protein [Chryseobacterium sp.]|uniref:helix-turn-helix domain-containing protein n=1 Tax=Chryseobacterium sp. TaxID=1871047 RepID=UPI0011C98900|nr:helix-turn-helix transcriptional regulator [Chryseobacterium sp.]TXF77792.1 helix-turn-helix transcriptional regulator [Chryseobacterium sp.]